MQTRVTRLRYGMMYGVHKTTLYLPEDLRQELSRAARACGWTEAETVRAALRAFIPGLLAPEPTLPLFSSGDETLAERVDDALEGFGER
jgi:hypothetical protein